MKNHIHIIAFDIPYPANYGGVIDVYYRLLSLYQSNIRITLHCFQYREKKTSPELESFCDKVYYYKRKTGILSNLSLLPYIVNSRKDKKLIENLLKDHDPILFEGKHCCFYLNDNRLKNRLKIVRLCNVEYDYYTGLVKAEKSFWKKAFFYIESLRLKKFQKKLKKADVILPISEKDTLYFKRLYPEKRVEHLSAFHPYNDFDIKTGRGEYVLYHGKLSVPENENAVNFLIKEVFSKEKDLPLIIAGSEPTKFLKDLCGKHENITLIENPSDEAMKKLIQDAALHLLYTFQPTGIKLKLISVLFNGRFCVVNDKMLEGIGFESTCVVANTPQEINIACRELINKPFMEKDRLQRIEEMKDKFSNQENLKKLLHFLDS